MDGITFCHKLKNDMRISHIPVILLTARTLADSIIEGFESRADDYLTKPFNERVLSARINNILQSRQEIRERVRREMILNPHKKVKALTGMSAIGFVKDFRLKRAAQLLLRNELLITEIAYMVGYSERRHFSMDFKRKFNLTPKEYFERHKNSKS